ncbi:hypothetical protein BKP45_09785 [Anaerobacillus alkalidiazotrophicus]|uniref:Flagellar hook-length control protein-like C-terminal domain-containing protein n=1 Tax=Anaerobacillus alkalidiazotrophicus TaxID=472963 RepID=A0A1S2M6L8_9BACI|nr:hypothetical protein [Anaerobacillus alkalidiazotrophicus]OIJ20341.1 hypothetical protein BKP45_09785 [Anaerobacillus alkalidiazotrophicus]
MHINSQTISNQLKTHDNTPEFRQGEIHRATVKERSSQNEAILQIRGRDVPVKFEGNVPSNERIMIQVSGQSDQYVQVRAIADSSKTNSSATHSDTVNINHALRSLGVSNPSPELRQATQIILDKGVALNRESVQELRTFVEKEKGTLEQRLNTVQAVANKRLEVTINHLRPVHEALHGRPLNEVLTNIVKEIDPNFNLRREQTSMERQVSDQVRDVREQVQREPNVQRAVEQVRNEVVNNPRVDREIARQVDRAVEESRMMHQSGREAVGRAQLVQALQTAEREIVRTEARQVEGRVPESRPAVERQVSEQVREVREQVQREPNVQRSVEQVRSEVVNHPRIDREVARQVERTVEESRVLHQSGREVAARERLIQALQTAEREIVRTEARQVEARVPEGRPAVERPVSEQVREVREQVQREPNVQRAVEQVRNEVVNNPRIDREVARQVERAVEESRIMHQKGRRSAGRAQLVQALQTAEREIVRTEARQVEGRVPESSPAVERQVSEQVREVREQVQREPNVQRSIDQVRNEVANHPRLNHDLVPQLEKILNEAQSLNRNGHESIAKNHLVQSLVNIEKMLKNNHQTMETQLSSVGKRDSINQVELVNQMKSTIQKEGDFQKVISQLQNDVEKALFEHPIKKQIINSLEDATKLNEQGRELAARQQLMQTFTTVEQQVANTDQTIQLEAQQYTMNDNFQSQQLSSKNMIVQTITEKLAQAQVDFKSLQREIARNLDNIQRLTEAFKSQSIKQVKPLLETTIKKLDNTILKSEMMLLTDMKTEKRLMQASSQLAEAKKLLTKGNYQEANKIVQEVKTMVEKLEFKPSETKVKHFITREEQNIQNRPPSQQIIQQFDEMTRRTAATQDFSARQAFELVRGLGLNRDNEVAQMLASGREGDSEPNQNMKTALMQLMKMEEEQGRVSQQTNQALANITGQQLLSKSDSNSNLQSMFFSLPFLLEDEVENLQVFVNSRNEGQQVDWENCNLYFLIETRKLGEVGILVTTTDRNLSLTIKNDQPFFKERIEPLAALCKENLKDVGYNITSINFTKLNATPSSNNGQEKGRDEQENMTPTFTEKGFDFKI